MKTVNFSDSDWKDLVTKLEQQFGEGLNADSIVFLIGVQELGKGFVKLKKDEKLEVMHVGICTLLEPYGIYKFEGRDEDGWPHFSRTGKLPHLKGDEQELLLKKAIMAYFENISDEE